MQQQIYSHWHGYQNISHLVIFGDSYSDVGYRSSSMLHPSEEHPLGVVFPGYSWAEDHKPNWVGYLITEFAPGHAMLVYDYAVGGDRVNGVVSQIQRHFIPKVGQKPDWAPWSSDDTLFITWVGINDCAFIATEKNIRDSMDKLFEQQDHLSPAVPVGRAESTSLINKLWNQILREAVTHFTSTHPDATAFIYSSYNLFTRILDDPVAYGFQLEDRRKRGGRIWKDHIHPKTRVHQEIARDVSAFLEAQPAFGNGDVAESQLPGATQQSDIQATS
ncbi:unnamed protein product [Somion occarium]|uniref:Carbohydrate esterase family 16 protein n=1 Tax=Somion occarium TaxID=3059160 RepID=A0ABP1DBZ0_9APHY